MYLVEIVKEPKINDFRAGFFPRKVKYKADAEALRKEVADKGGLATFKRV